MNSREFSSTHIRSCKPSRGVGASRKRALLQHFGSARAVAGASLSDLESVGGVSKTLAKKVYDFFHPTG